jgi:adenine deaminase
LLRGIIDASMGDAPHDLVVRGGLVVNIFTAEVEAADVGIWRDRIVTVGDLPAGAIGARTKVVRANGRALIPGLIDPHFHMGGSQLCMPEWSRALLRCGTTTIATDLAEIYSYAGAGGVRFALNEAKKAGLRVWYLPPVHLFGLEQQGSFRHPPDAEEMIRMLDWPEAIGVNEPPPAQVLGKNSNVLRVIAAAQARGLTFAGHLPGVDGHALQAYVAAGGNSCHESTTVEEARLKLAVGVWPMLRFGSAGPDLPELLPLVTNHAAAARWSMFCTDDQDPSDLEANGNVNRNIRMAVAAGIEPPTAISMGSTNPALYYGKASSLGSISPGRIADVVAVADLSRLDVTDVVVAGEPLVRDGELVRKPIRSRYPASLQSRIRWRRELRDFDLAVASSGSAARVRVIGVKDGSLLSEALVEELAVVNGSVVADPDRDISKVAVVDRNSGNLTAGVAFVRGTGIRDGAVASTYCHGHQNLLLIGATDEQMQLAASSVQRMGGGVAVVSGSRVTATWALPLIGVFSTDPIHRAVSDLANVRDALHAIGCTFSSPVLALAFVALTTIPSYGLTERGLYDVDREEFVPTVIEELAS